MALPLPAFFEPDDVRHVRMERAGLVADAARAYRDQHGLRPAAEDRVRVAAFGIDCQIGFASPGASLFVPGAVEDMQRAIRWLYANLEHITSLYFSLDTHRVFQIFHPAFWRDEHGHPPGPFTPIFHEDVRARRWTPTNEHLYDTCLEYTRKLEQGGKYVLNIWPYHTLLGGVSHALVPALMEASIFHAIARETPTVFETKGMAELTEMYSVLSPEVTELDDREVGSFNEALFDALMSHDRIYVFGEAKSHCVLSTLQDLMAHIEARDATLADRVFILEDAMSPVPPPPLDPLPAGLDFPRRADEGLVELAAQGMRIVRTTEEIAL